MTTLIFARHASAVGSQDSDPLLQEGYAQAAERGALLTRIYRDLRPDSVKFYSSGKLRTFQTAKVMSESIGFEDADIIQDRIFETLDSANGMIQGLDKFLPRGLAYAICVSHDPVVDILYNGLKNKGVRPDEDFESPRGYAWDNSCWRPDV